ncbi:MAG: helix-turn-helix transcriptional regulator [Propionibacteriaceae bacterium]|nr:helix-turn-helix transcriptional regulator [Propionibacteriaceae bacterium]
MIVTERRFEVILIDAGSLRNYMRFRGFTVRTLARRVGVSRATIGHLRAGHRNTCNPETAKSIALALDCPVESLFIARTSNVLREIGPKPKAAA